jgi:hypothetical protein
MVTLEDEPGLPASLIRPDGSRFDNDVAAIEAALENPLREVFRDRNASDIVLGPNTPVRPLTPGNATRSDASDDAVTIIGPLVRAIVAPFPREAAVQPAHRRPGDERFAYMDRPDAALRSWVGQVASALGVVPRVGTVAAGTAPILSALSKLQFGCVPQDVKGFDW